MINIKELILGHMSDSDMADWCGKPLAKFKKNRSRWSETTLSKYADFTIIRGDGFQITKIYDPIFSPSCRKIVQQKWHSYWGNDNNMLDSNKECWLKMKSSLPQLGQITDKAGQSYVSTFKCEDYGSARRTAKRKVGTKGYCKYTYCIILPDYPRKFDSEDLDKKAELEALYLDTTYKQQKYEMRALYSEYKRGEISKTEYEEEIDALVELDLGWMEFEEHFNDYLQAKYGEYAYADFRQELVESAFEMNSGPFDF